MPNADRSVADYAEQTLLSDVAVAPDGDRVAYVATDFDLDEDDRRTSVFVAPTDGSRDPHRLSRVADASSPQWSPDGSRLAIIASREEDVELAVETDSESTAAESPNGNDSTAGDDSDADSPKTDDAEEEPKPQVWVYDLELGGDPRQVTTREEGVSEFDWGPDGERIVVAAEDPTDEEREYRDQLDDDGPIETRRLQHKYDGSGWLDTVTTHLFVVDVETRETSRLDEAYGGGASEPGTGLSPAWSPDGDRIAFLSNRTDRPDNTQAMDVYTVRPDGTGLTKLTESELRCSGVRWSPSGDRLAFYGRVSGDMYEPTQLYASDAEDEFWSVSDSLDRPTGRGGPIVWTDDETLLTAVGDEGLTRLVRFDATADDPERVFGRQGEYRTISTVDGTTDTLAMVVSDPAEGADLYTLAVDAVDDEPSVDEVDRGVGDADPLVRLTSSDANLFERYDAPRCKRITVESGGDGAEHEAVEAFVYLPADFDSEADDGDDNDDPLPTIASIHGGPVSYDAPQHKFSYLHWTNRGYAVVRTNYRGSSSYGKPFSESISGEWGAREPLDVIVSVDEAVDRGWANADRLFVTGFSYGGVTTAFALTESDRFRAAAAEHGIYDRYSYFGTGDSHNRMEADFGLPWEDEDTYRSISSITDVGDIDTPLLITAGGQDWRCPPTQAEQLYVSVKKQDVPAKLVVYPDEHHSITNPERAVHRLEELDDWFDEFDGTEETGESDEASETGESDEANETDETDE
ncbi:MAG: prolyl oligopeptidase family serine peptidase [Halopenitus sp.]